MGRHQLLMTNRFFPLDFKTCAFTELIDSMIGSHHELFNYVTSLVTSSVKTKSALRCYDARAWKKFLKGCCQGNLHANEENVPVFSPRPI